MSAYPNKTLSNKNLKLSNINRNSSTNVSQNHKEIKNKKNEINIMRNAKTSLVASDAVIEKVFSNIHNVFMDKELKK